MVDSDQEGCVPLKDPKSYYERNKEKILEKCRAYRLANKDRINARHREQGKVFRERNKQNPDFRRRRREHSLAYSKTTQGCLVHALMALKRRANGSPCASIDDLVALWERQAGLCALTGVPMDPSDIGGPFRPSLDHIVPVSCGGGHTADNLHLVTKAANMARSNLSVDRFKSWLNAVAEARQRLAA